VAYVLEIFESFLGECHHYNDDSEQAQFDCIQCSIDNGMPQGDKKGNLEVNFAKNVFKCWVCRDTNNMYGSLVKLIRKYGNEKNLNDYKLFKPEAFLSKEDREIISVKLPETYTKFFDCNIKDYKYNQALNYLKNRGINEDLIDKYNIGFTTGGIHHNRIVIPSYDCDNNLNYYVARWCSNKANKIKYLNPDVNKEDIIFNEKFINWDSTIYLVEGATDHIVIPNSIPMLGKYISSKLLFTLRERACGNICIILDCDAHNDAVTLYKQLDFGNLKGRIRIVKIQSDSGLDPSSIHQKFGKSGVIKLLGSAKQLN
jgi:DNA primase